MSSLCTSTLYPVHPSFLLSAFIDAIFIGLLLSRSQELLNFYTKSPRQLQDDIKQYA